MEFLRIGESKIKIVLNGEETEKYGINPREDGSGAASNASVWRILDRAREECGFDPRGDKVLVQFYPLKSGCELFVTKLGILSSDSMRAVTRSERVTLLSRRERYYSFPDKDSLLRAAREISRRTGKPQRSSLYFDADTYVLSLVEHSSSDGAELAFIKEFARPLPQDIGTYISEHFDTLYSDDAIDRLINNNC